MIYTKSNNYVYSVLVVKTKVWSTPIIVNLIISTSSISAKGICLPTIARAFIVRERGYMESENEFKILSKTKEFINYSNKYIVNTIPKSNVSIRIKYETNMYELIEEIIRANANKGNIRCKSIKEIIVKCDVIDFYLGILYEEKIIKYNRFSSVIKIVNEIVKMSNGWLVYEENK